MKALPLLASAALLLAGCKREPSPSESGTAPVVAAPVQPVPAVATPRMTPPPPLTVRASVLLLPDGARSTGTVDEVRMAVDISGMAGEHEVSLEVFAPGGSADDPTGAVYVRQASVVRGTPQDSQRTEFVMPVSGTYISQRGMSGAWDARFYIDGEPVAVSTFTLEP